MFARILILSRCISNVCKARYRISITKPNVRGGSLLKSNAASQRGFKGATDAAFDVIFDERFEQTADLSADGARDV